MSLVLKYAALLCFTVSVLLSSRHLIAQDNSTSSQMNETIVLFDGSNLDHWRGYHQEAIGSGWTIEDGILKYEYRS